MVRYTQHSVVLFPSPLHVIISHAYFINHITFLTLLVFSTQPSYYILE
jgi:hypothetical protein